MKRRLTGLHGRKNGSDTRELGIEVTRIRRTANLRDKWRRNALMIDVIPIDIPKEGMGHDLLGIRRPRTETKFRFASKQFLEDGDRVARHVNRVQRLVGQDSVVDFILVLAAERRLLEQHLVD